MPLAVKQDILDRYPRGILPMIPDPEDPDGEETVDDKAVDKALADAEAEIYPYLRGRYDLPVTGTVPAILVLVSVDIARYRMAADAMGNTEERRKRYEDALKKLKSMAKGEMVLELSEPVSEADSAGCVVISGPARIFSRDSMRGL